MRFFHISDLHIGKQLNGYSLRENQEQVLSQILFYAKKEKPDAILICGDIYDKSVPSGEAHTVFDSFLNGLSKLSPVVSVLVIAGNHDSPERLKYASAFLEQHHIHISTMPPQNEGEYLRRVPLSDEWGIVNFYLFPFMKPGYVRTLPEAGDSLSYDEAFRMVMAREQIDYSERNVILSHQFFTGGKSEPETCDSELAVLSVGGVDQIDISVLKEFDYVALGHLHGPQKLLREEVRYCGSPCKYSVSEEHHKKSVTLVTLEEKGKPVGLEFLPLTETSDVRREKGRIDEIVSRVTEKPCHDFVSITVTDEEEPVNLREMLEEAYDHILEIRVDNSRTRKRMKEDGETVEVQTPFEAFRQFYEAVRHMPMTEEQERLMEQIVNTSGEDEE